MKSQCFLVFQRGEENEITQRIPHATKYDECIPPPRLSVMNSIKNRSKFTDLQRAGPKSLIIKMYQLRASPSNIGFMSQIIYS